MKNTFLFKLLALFIFPFVIAGIIILTLTTLYSIAVWDFSTYQIVIDFFSPVKHMWVRILYEVWAVISFILVINFGTEVEFF